MLFVTSARDLVAIVRQMWRVAGTCAVIECMLVVTSAFCVYEKSLALTVMSPKLMLYVSPGPLSAFSSVQCVIMLYFRNLVSFMSLTEPCHHGRAMQSRGNTNIMISIWNRS